MIFGVPGQSRTVIEPLAPIWACGTKISGRRALPKPSARVAPTTPTISASSGRPAICTVSRCSNGSVSGQCRRASVSLITATPGRSASSRSSKRRPARSGMRIASK